MPAWFRRWLAKSLPWKDLNHVVDIVDIMNDTSVEILEEKKRALEKGDDAVVHQIAEGRDIMSVLRKRLMIVQMHMLERYSLSFVVQANLSASEDLRLPESEILAQMSYVDLFLCSSRDNAHREWL